MNFTDALYSGCGPIGLITAAVAHAYSARRIIAFDINPARVDFARKYLSPLTGKPIIDHVYHIEPLPTVAQTHPTTNGDASIVENGEIPVAEEDEAEHEETEGDIKWEWAKKRMTQIIRECGLEAEEGVDRVIEASGADDAMLHGVAICKEGGICELTTYHSIPPYLWYIVYKSLRLIIYSFNVQTSRLGWAISKLTFSQRSQ